MCDSKQGEDKRSADQFVVGAEHGLLTLAGNGCDSGRRGGHHSRAPHAGRGGAGGGDAGAGACLARLALAPAVRVVGLPTARFIPLRGF